MPNILAIDTSTQICSVAIWQDGKIIERYEHKPQQHAQLILAMLEDLLKEAKLAKQQLDAIAYACGPGSFTGIRLGAAIVQAMAFSLALPVIPISSLLALAQTAYRIKGWQAILTVVDARMEEVYECRFKLAVNGLMQPCQSEQLTKPELISIDEQGYCGVGDGWAVYQKLLPAQILEVASELYPQAQDVAILAAEAYRHGKTLPALQALPSYLRDNMYKSS
jgi:tRNA threonylcarbamoyladenosine biosynthesis protein TsaB